MYTALGNILFLFTQEDGFVMTVFPTLVRIGRLVDNMNNAVMMVTEMRRIHTLIGTTTDKVI